MADVKTRRGQYLETDASNLREALYQGAIGAALVLGLAAAITAWSLHML